jgi:hypothetical protein
LNKAALISGHRHIRDPHATSNAAPARSPRVTQVGREYARGQGLDWNSLDPARQVERKDEQLREAGTPVQVKNRQVRQAEAQKAGLRSALDQAEAELARIKSSRSWRLVSRLSRLRSLAAVGQLVPLDYARAATECVFGDKFPVSSHDLGRRHSLADDVVSGLGSTCKCRSISK